LQAIGNALDRAIVDVDRGRGCTGPGHPATSARPKPGWTSRSTSPAKGERTTMTLHPRKAAIEQKHARVAELLQQGLSTSIIRERLGATWILINRVRQELRAKNEFVEHRHHAPAESRQKA
jgi:hypothetical protein